MAIGDENFRKRAEEAGKNPPPDPAASARVFKKKFEEIFPTFKAGLTVDLPNEKLHPGEYAVYVPLPFNGNLGKIGFEEQVSFWRKKPISLPAYNICSWSVPEAVMAARFPEFFTAEKLAAWPATQKELQTHIRSQIAGLGEAEIGFRDAEKDFFIRGPHPRTNKEDLSPGNPDAITEVFPSPIKRKVIYIPADLMIEKCPAPVIKK